MRGWVVEWKCGGAWVGQAVNCVQRDVVKLIETCFHFIPALTQWTKEGNVATKRRQVVRRDNSVLEFTVSKYEEQIIKASQQWRYTWNWSILSRAYSIVFKFTSQQLLILVTWILVTIVVLFDMAQLPAGRRRLESIETELKEAKEKLEKVGNHKCQKSHRYIFSQYQC